MRKKIIPAIVSFVFVFSACTLDSDSSVPLIAASLSGAYLLAAAWVSTRKRG